MFKATPSPSPYPIMLMGFGVEPPDGSSAGPSGSPLGCGGVVACGELVASDLRHEFFSAPLNAAASTGKKSEKAPPSLRAVVGHRSKAEALWIQDPRTSPAGEGRPRARSWQVWRVTEFQTKMSSC